MVYIKKQEVKMSLKFMELLKKIIVVNVEKNMMWITYLKTLNQFQNVNVED